MKRPPLTRRARTMVLLSSAGIAAALLATSVAPANAGKGHSSGLRPTVVLVHGAFANSTSWKGVVKELKREGHPVVAAANPLRGLAGDSTYLKEILAASTDPWCSPATPTWAGSSPTRPAVRTTSRLSSMSPRSSRRRGKVRRT